MKILFLHLSDIHLASGQEEVLNRVDGIAATTYQHLPDIEAIFLIVSGDIAWSGKAEEYSYAERLLCGITRKIESEDSSKRVHIVLCPGNHDCDFSKHDDTRDAVLAKIRGLDGKQPSQSLVDTSTSIQSAYFDFRNKVSLLDWKAEDQLSCSAVVEVGKHRIGLRCLNVAWMSELREKQGTLVYPAEAIVPFEFDKEAGLAVTVLHHPFNWFGQSSYRNFQTTTRRESHLIFSGHEHFQNYGEIADANSSPSAFIDGGALYDKEQPTLSAYNIVIVDLDSKNYSVEMYNLVNERYETSIEIEEQGSLQQLPVKGGQKVNLNPEFASTLQDAGANFSHSAKKTLLLDDIFVWPELLCLDDPALVKRKVGGSFLENIENLNSGVFVRGDEKTGKSTLLKQYFSSYYSRGYLPVYFRGSWFTKVHQKNSLKAVKLALEKQYVHKDHITWLQESKEKKVLLLDDLDAATLTGEVLSNSLAGLFQHFSAIIIMAKDGADSIDLLSVDRVQALNKFTQYEIREFGHKKRFELVCKWAAIGGQDDESTDGWIATIDKWEKDLTSAVGSQFVPAVPIFLLTLLQSIESGRTADLQNSAFGHYYQYLVTSALQQQGIERGQWAEVFNYCAHLAWQFHSKNLKQISPIELELFSTQYSREFTPVAHEKRIRELVNSGVITAVDSEYEFKYPYIYFFFLGQHISNEIHEPEMKSVISKLCQDLHLRDNANILLFTSHHTKNAIIYEKIAEALSDCFPSDSPFDFDTDVVLLNKLVNSAPRLIFNESSTKTTRSQVRERQDIAEENSDEKEFASLPDIFSAITRLMRTVEILGQFLKNHYGTTKNPVKEDLINKLFQGMLRGLHAITTFLLNDVDAVADHIEKLLSEHRPDMTFELRNEHAKRVVFDLIGNLTHAFIHKVSTSVGSPYLKQNLEVVVKETPSLSNKIIEMSYLLDLPESLPFQRLKELNKAVEKNVFSRSLICHMALRHMHMFKVTYKDKQRLCEELEITLNRQLSIDRKRILN